VDALAPFSQPVRDWFERTFDAPTPAQERGWPAIASGKHTLIQAPTGSGKTLAAFLWALDQARPGEGTQVLYVSPLKALNYDVERNDDAEVEILGATGVHELHRPVAGNEAPDFLHRPLSR
jgi:ATP-dependent Lhr-like helicase